MEKTLCVNSIKVIRIGRSLYGNCYHLVACEDQNGVTTCKPGANGSVLKNSEWKNTWLQLQQCYSGKIIGKCRLMSIYDKMLAVSGFENAKKNKGMLRLYQSQWPVINGSVDEWYFELEHKNGGFEFYLFVSYGPKLYYLDGSPHDLFRAEGNAWVYKYMSIQWNFEVVQTDSQDEKNANLMIHPNNSHHQAMSFLSGSQIGKVVLTVIGGGSSGGIFNSGHNINYDGKQTNGDVNVHTEIDKDGAFTVHFKNKSRS